MRRRIAIAFLSALLAAPLLPAQIRGIPPSVTSLSPGQPISSAPPASVTSLGPFGWQVPPGFQFIPGSNFGFIPGSSFQFIPGSNFQFVSGFRIGHRPRFEGFRRNRGFLGPFGGGAFAGGAAFPVYVPVYSSMPLYPTMVYPVPAGYGGEEEDSEAATSGYAPMSSRASTAAPQPEAAPAVSSAPAAPAEVQAQEPTVLVFRDGHRLEVGNYAIVGTQLLNLSGNGPRKIALSDLDVDATTRVNDERGVEFRLPTGVRGQ